MSRLQRELERLYGLGAPGAHTPASAPRALVLEVARPADWTAIGAVWQGVQSDLALPAPAIAVNGQDGYQLWFSLSEPLPPAEGAAFLDGLQQRYLSEVAPKRMSCWTCRVESQPAWPTTPRPLPGDDHWSAFVAPDLAPIFATEPWLDFPPGDDAQADILQGLRSIALADFRSALAHFTPLTDTVRHPPAATESLFANDAMASNTLGPREFLHRVMNDPNTPLALRIEAAKALLSHKQ